MADVLVRQEAECLHVTIDRPEKRNPLSRAVLAGLRQAFATRRDDEALRVAVVTGAGEKSFAAGGDLRELQGLRSAEEARVFSDESHGALDEIRRFPLPVVAALNGDALGGGAELAVACDMRVMGSHARIGFIQGRLAIPTSWGGGSDLARLVGSARALSLLARSAILSAPDALAIGLADAVAPEGEALPDCLERFIAPIRRQSPHVLRAFKAQASAERFGTARDERRRDERESFCRAWVHDDHWAAADKVLAPARAS